MNFILKVFFHLYIYGMVAVFGALDAVRWTYRKVRPHMTTPNLRTAVLAFITIAFLVALVKTCQKAPEAPQRLRPVIVVDGTSHPFRDTLVVYRDRIVHAPADTVVRVLRRIVHDTVVIDSSGSPAIVPEVCIPETTLRKATIRIMTDSVKIYDDSVRHHYDSLSIRSLENTPPIVVTKEVEVEKTSLSTGLKIGGTGFLLGALGFFALTR